MRFFDEWSDLLSTLKNQKFRAFLTLLGIILGVGALVFSSSLIAGMGKFMEHKLQQATGEDVITVSKRWWEEASVKGAPSLSHFDSRALRRSPTLEGSTVLNRYSMRVPYGTRFGQHIWVVGTTPQAQGFYGLEIARGRFIHPTDERDVSRVAVLGSDAVKILVPGGEPLGKEVKLNGQRFFVVGVLKPKPAMGAGGMFTWNGSVVMSEASFTNRLARSKQLHEIVVKTKPSLLQQYGLAHLAYATRLIVTARHQGVQNFMVTDPLKEAQSNRIAQLIVLGLEGAIAAVCLLVGGINIMNILLVTVTQRTREIGIRRALGATKGSIQRQFLSEAALLAGIGGVLGVAGGAFLAWLLSLILSATLGHWPFLFQTNQAVLGFCFSLFTGLLFGWYPAKRASELSPITALRFE